MELMTSWAWLRRNADLVPLLDPFNGDLVAADLRHNRCQILLSS